MLKSELLAIHVWRRLCKERGTPIKVLGLKKLVGGQLRRMYQHMENCQFCLSYEEVLEQIQRHTRGDQELPPQEVYLIYNGWIATGEVDAPRVEEADSWFKRQFCPKSHDLARV